MLTVPDAYDIDPFRVEFVPERDVIRVCPIGELDMATAPELDAQLREVLGAGFRHVVLDLSRLTFIDSTGLRLVLGFDALARQDGFDLALIQGPDLVRRASELCGMLDRLPFRAA